MADVPYRLWSDQTAEAPPAKQTIVAKLKPAATPARRLVRGAVAGEPETRLTRLVANARIRAIRAGVSRGR